MQDGRKERENGRWDGERKGGERKKSLDEK